MEYGWLNINHASGAEQTLNIAKPTLTLGRADDNDVVLNNNAVSSYHAQMTFHGDGWQITDLNSANGTYVDGDRLDSLYPRLLGFGSTIQLGTARIVVNQGTVTPTSVLGAAAVATGSPATVSTPVPRARVLKTERVSDLRGMLGTLPLVPDPLPATFGSLPAATLPAVDGGSAITPAPGPTAARSPGSTAASVAAIGRFPTGNPGSAPGPSFALPDRAAINDTAAAAFAAGAIPAVATPAMAQNDPVIGSAVAAVPTLPGAAPVAALVMPITLRATPLDLSIAPGGTALVTVKLVNQSNIVDRLTLAVDGLPASWVTIMPPMFSLFPGAEAAAQIIISPTLVPTSLAGSYPFTIFAHSEQRPASNTQTPAILTVLPLVTYTEQLAPQQRTAYHRASYRLLLQNHGNVPLPLQLKASDDEHRIAFTFADQALTLAPGQTRSTLVRTQVPWRVVGNTSLYPFTISVIPADEQTPPQEVIGRLMQRAVIPLQLLMFLLPLLLLAGLLLFALYKARNPPATALAGAGPTVNPAASNAGPGAAGTSGAVAGPLIGPPAPGSSALPLVALPNGPGPSGAPVGVGIPPSGAAITKPNAASTLPIVPLPAGGSSGAAIGTGGTGGSGNSAAPPPAPPANLIPSTSSLPPNSLPAVISTTLTTRPATPLSTTLSTAVPPSTTLSTAVPPSPTVTPTETAPSWLASVPTTTRSATTTTVPPSLTPTSPSAASTVLPSLTPTLTGQMPTNLVVSVSPPTSNNCTTPFVFTGQITMAGPGSVSYKWDRSDGSVSPETMLTFTAAGTQSVNDTWQVSLPVNTSYNGWARLRTVSPNSIVSNQATFTANCPASVTAVTVAVAQGNSPFVVRQVGPQGSCPVQFNFTANITMNGAGSVTYQWERSDGTASPQQSLTFTGAATQTASMSWQVVTAMSGWAQLHILSPNAVVSNQAPFRAECTNGPGSIAASVSPTQSTSCATPFIFTAAVTADAAATITYDWERSDGTIGQQRTLTFTAAGTQTITDTWELTIPPNTSYSGWARLRIVSPTAALSNPATFTATCSRTPTNIVASVSPPSSTSCTTTFVFTGQITMDGPGSVSYKWDRSDGMIGPERTLNFTAASTQAFTDTWQISLPVNANYNGWARVRTVSPNSIVSNQATFTSNCPPSVTGITITVTPTATPTVMGTVRRQPVLPAIPRPVVAVKPAGVGAQAAYTCANGFIFTADITMNGAGTVSYQWERSDGTTLPAQTLAFNAAGTQRINNTWTLQQSSATHSTGWGRVRTTMPNVVVSNDAAFTSDCPPAVTQVTASVSPATSTSCSTQFMFSGQITADGPGTISYYWYRNDGSTTASQSLAFNAAGTQTVTSSLQLDLQPNGAAEGWLLLNASTPISSRSSSYATYSATCPAAVTAVAGAVSPSSSSNCAQPILSTGQITMNGYGTAGYQWIRSDGTKTAAQTLSFTAAGTQTITNTWQFDLPPNATYTGWSQLQTLTPNVLNSQQATFSINCPATVTSVITNVNPPSSTQCAAEFDFAGQIALNGYGTVTYRWERSDGTSGATQSLSLTAAGTANVVDEWLFTLPPNGAYNGWGVLHVLSPNDVYSNQATFSASCPASVTSVTAAVSPQSTTTCPTTFNFSGQITMNGSGTVSYVWERSDGTTTASTSLSFNGAATQTVTDAWQPVLAPGTPATGWAQLRIVSPNSVTSSRATWTATCPASLSQSFIPTLPALSRVQIRLRVGGSFPAAGITTTLRVHAVSPTGPIIGTANVFIGNGIGVGSTFLATFDFAPVVSLTPGNTYVIEWMSEPGAIVSWMGTPADTYSRGTAFGCTGQAAATEDLNFLTYSPPQVSNPSQVDQANDPSTGTSFSCG